MANLISSHLGINAKAFEKARIFDAVVGVDTRLFIDPFLLKRTKIPEFIKSRKKIEDYYSNIIRLLTASQARGDRAWREALKRLTFKELHGVSIGYGVHGSDGSAIGPGLALRLIDTASEIIAMGIKDPEIFELIGLFEKDFGADRLSDMTIAIIKEDIYKYTQRLVKVFKLSNLVEVRVNDRIFHLPKHPTGDTPLVLLPKELLRNLPVALSWDGIDHVVSTNRALRDRINQLIGKAWKNKITKRELRNIILNNKENIEKLLGAYRSSKSTHYDFENDPSGEVTWYRIGKDYATANHLILQPQTVLNIDDLESIVRKIINQFKRNIEVNGLSNHIYIRDGFKLRPRHERYSQLLFYSTADTYCEANNVDISREPNAGIGPVDFKLSAGYNARVLVEIKLSSNKMLVKGFEKQLPSYNESENTDRSFYVVLKVTKSKKQIERLLRVYDQLKSEKKMAPEIIIIDGTIQPSASKRK